MSGGAHEEFRLMLEKYKYPPQLLDAFRAEVLREAADKLTKESNKRAEAAWSPSEVEAAQGWQESAWELRRMADEVMPGGAA